MTSIANPGLNVNGLHEHIMKDEMVSLKFTKVPGKLVVEEAKDNIPLWQKQCECAAICPSTTA